MRITIIFLAFFLVSCNSTNQVKFCDVITCINGDCVNDSCECYDHYEGEDCSYQMRPVEILLTGVSLVDWPEKNNGNDWDMDGTEPDIQLVISIPDPGSWGTAIIENTIEDSIYELDFINQYRFTHYHFYTFSLREYTNGNSVLMDSKTCRIYNDQNSFPEVIRIEGDEMIVDLEVKYIFD